MKPSIVLYRGPSMLDGSPIVVLASVGSSNVKTGPMVQTWILRADMHPSEASKRKADSAVCGSCPRRHSLGGDCYVQIVHAPRATWESWDKQGRPGENWSDERAILALQADALTHGLRLGSYGDPMAVPHTVWQDLIAALHPRKVVGYTHQWRAGAVDPHPGVDVMPLLPNAEWFRSHLMASCDSAAEAAFARQLGWRYFLAVQPNTPIPERTILCPATRESNPLTCTQCGACNGAGTGHSIMLYEHGMRSQGKRDAISGKAKQDA